MSKSTSTSTTTTTLFGCLGKDPIERYTAERTEIKKVPDPVVEHLMVEKEITIPARPYWKLSLATHHGPETRWHDCIVWNPETRTSVRNAHLARKGDRVALVGQFEEYTFQRDGQTITGRHFVVEEFHFQRMRKPVEIP